MRRPSPARRRAAGPTPIGEPCPANAIYDQETKFDAYARAGVPEYAIIDPRTRSLASCRLIAPGRYGDPSVFGEQETATLGCLPGLTIPVGELFADVPDTTL